MKRADVLALIKHALQADARTAADTTSSAHEDPDCCREIGRVFTTTKKAATKAASGILVHIHSAAS